jgi:hypothetical protein
VAPGTLCRLNGQQVAAVSACCDAACLDLQEAAGGLLTAALAAAAYCQAALLTPKHLATDSFAHKVRCGWDVVGVGAVGVGLISAGSSTAHRRKHLAPKSLAHKVSSSSRNEHTLLTC